MGSLESTERHGYYMNHLSVDEIERITDTSDLSPEYLGWYESVEAHLADCALCREQIRRKILCDDLSDAATLKTGIKMLEREEEIRRNIVISKLLQQGITDWMLIKAIWERKYVRFPLAPGRMSHAVYRGETGQEDMTYEWHDNMLKIVFKEEQFRGIELDYAQVILTDKSMKAGVEKPVQDENGYFMACFEGIGETDDLIVYVVEDKSERKSVTPNRARYGVAFYEQSMTPSGVVFEREEYRNRKNDGNGENEKPVSGETEDNEHRKNNESEDDA